MRPAAGREPALARHRVLKPQRHLSRRPGAPPGGEALHKMCATRQRVASVYVTARNLAAHARTLRARSRPETLKDGAVVPTCPAPLQHVAGATRAALRRHVARGSAPQCACACLPASQQRCHRAKRRLHKRVQTQVSDANTRRLVFVRGDIASAGVKLRRRRAAARDRSSMR